MKRLTLRLGALLLLVTATLAAALGTPTPVDAVPPSVADLTADRVISAHGTSPTTDGRYVFWADTALSSLERRDVVGYDIATDSRLGVAVGNDVNWSPRTRGGAVTWFFVPPYTYDYSARIQPISEILPNARQPDPGTTSPNWTYYPETGHYLAYGFRAFWTQFSGLLVFGYPLTKEFVQHDLTVQYLERQRFEYHPKFVGTPYETELGRLGAEDAQTRGLLTTAPFQPLPAGTPSDANCAFFKETGYRLCFGFKSYWQAHGLEFGDPGISYRESLALFGYPISEEFVDLATGLTVQYFERAVFEYHPDNPEPYKVELRLLGSQQFQEFGWK